ncbi:MAG TPA: hypothetical protein VK206_22460, partial [Anaerolineales bacterium]|nr:hypothetical protein [Anaerolineales bacterium]
MIVLLWFLSRNQWKAHAKRITDGLLASNATPKAIQWEPISPPDANGVRTTNGAYALSGDAGSIEIKAYGKDENAIIEFTKEDKFYFEPVFEKLPVSPISRLLGSLSQNNRLAKNYADSPSARMPMQLSSSDADLELEQPEDIFVEFDVSSVKKPKSGDEGKPVQAIAYIIDPRVAQGRCKTYSAKVTAVYDTVSVSEGSV